MQRFKKILEQIDKKLLSKRSFTSLYNTGVEAYFAQSYEKAIKFFKLAIAKKNAKPQVYYNLALSYQCVNDYERAIVAYNKFIELKPTDYDGLYNLALAYYQKENYAKAIIFFEKCVHIKKDEDGIKALVISYLNQNKIQCAIDFANVILQTPEVGIGLYYSIAKVFENKNSSNKDFTYLDAAIAMYSKIVEINPQHFDSYLAISICYAKKGEWEPSVNFCKKAIEANPKSYEANNQMGLVYYCREEVEEAIKYYETALSLMPEGDYKIYSNLGYAYEKIGQYEQAIKIFSQLIAKFPNFPAKDEIKNHMRVLKDL